MCTFGLPPAVTTSDSEAEPESGSRACKEGSGEDGPDFMGSGEGWVEGAGEPLELGLRANSLGDFFRDFGMRRLINSLMSTAFESS
jgi:hypothetical protein